MVILFVSNTVCLGSNTGRVIQKTVNCEIGICYFSAKYVALRRKIKDLLVRNHNNVSEWRDISTCDGLLFL